MMSSIHCGIPISHVKTPVPSMMLKLLAKSASPPKVHVQGFTETYLQTGFHQRNVQDPSLCYALLHVVRM